MSEKEIAHLESINPFYEKGDYMDQLMIQREVEIIKRYDHKDKTALEVGCGDGTSTEQLYSLFPDLDVIEPSKKNISLLRKKLPNIVCHNTLLENYSTNKKYDFIFFLNVVEHVEDPIASLKTLTHFVKDEGLIFITAPNCMSLNRRAGYKMNLLSSYEQMAPKDIEVGHRRLYTVSMLKDHCEQADMRVLEMKGMYLKPLSEKQMINLGDDAVRAFYALGEDIPQYCASILAVTTKKYY